MTNSSGLATFNNVTISTAGIGLTLNANSTGLSQGTSSSFNVTVLVPNGSDTHDDAATDAGSGVKTVAYYYCSGYTVSCTSSSGAFIGSSSNSGNHYQVTWTGEPANGAYRRGRRRDGQRNNASGPSTSIPVTVNNIAPTVASPTRSTAPPTARTGRARSPHRYPRTRGGDIHHECRGRDRRHHDLPVLERVHVVLAGGALSTMLPAAGHLDLRLRCRKPHFWRHLHRHRSRPPTTPGTSAPARRPPSPTTPAPRR